MTTNSEAFVRFFIAIAGYSPRFIHRHEPADDQIERLTREVRHLQACQARKRKHAIQKKQPHNPPGS